MSHRTRLDKLERLARRQRGETLPPRLRQSRDDMTWWRGVRDELIDAGDGDAPSPEQREAMARRFPELADALDPPTPGSRKAQT